MNIFIQVVFPVLLVFIAGFILQKWKQLDIKSLSTVGLYIMTPALVFKSFYTAELNMQYLKMVGFALLLLVAIIFVNKIYAKMRGYSQSIESGLILSTAFMNSGNYGAPIILFAYGEKGFEYAVSFMVLQAIIMNFFGVYYAARGQAGVQLAVRSVLKMPPTYAVLTALVMNVFDIKMPENIFSSIDLVAKATIPTVMLILGMQLANIAVRNFQWGKIMYGTMMRLLISPIIAFLITLVLPMEPLLQKVLIVLSATPSAATTTMYAVQFDAEPEMVSSITFINTLISVVTITTLLVLLA
ncbi:AEC family transporter [Bacillus tianshenii]|nr:AEC family transporter [Bacillus tianshenii]